ncbi:orotate phosphoribosyltransferase-like protein [Geoglobus acetivorans]|uniref:Transcriptional regulator GfcR n=1 Tax=Geoglobus acetivorans TaxID=565033 RepID=A0A0A7GFK9_GEOAI|nr:Orotate phosphoribosyltransferase [Geoglobus acetivorans]
MSKIEELVERAKQLKEKGLTTGEIADELNISRDTAIWLLTSSRTERPPSDIYVELKSINGSSFRLREMARILADMVLDAGDADVIVGVATSGIPVATMVAEEIGCELSIYYPKKLKWDGEESHARGTFSENFANVSGKACVVVDDIITTGKTIHEVAESIRKRGGNVIAAAVIVDKRSHDDVEGIPVLSVLKVFRI